MKRKITRMLAMMLVLLMMICIVPTDVMAGEMDGQTAVEDAKYETSIGDANIYVYTTEGGGKISCVDSTDFTFAHGDWRLYKAEPNAGWEFAGFKTKVTHKENSVPNGTFGSDNWYYFADESDNSKAYSETSENADTVRVIRSTEGTVSEPVNYYVYAVFKPQITLENGIGGTAKREDSTILQGDSSLKNSVYYNEAYKYEINPNKGYEINKIVDQGEDAAITEEQRAGFTYEVKNVTKPRTVSVEYRPITYKIAYDGNGTASGEVSTQDAVYDKEVTLAEGTFINADYKLAGWNTKADGSGDSYKLGETVKNLTAKKGETVTLYAQWVPGNVPGVASVKIDDWTYGADPSVPVLESETNGIDNVQLTYISTDGKGYEGHDVPTEAGKYLVIAVFPENDRYKAVEAVDSFEILPKNIAEAEVTLGDPLTYTGSAITQGVESVVLDGKEVTFEVENDTETAVGVYELTVKGTGNYTGEVKKTWMIQPDTSLLDSVTLDNVTSANQEDIERIITSIEEADKELADEDTLKEWDDLTTQCNELLNRIDEASLAGVTENVEAVSDISSENVKLEDKETLQTAKEDLEKALADYGSNYTEEEIEAIQEELARIEEALASIERVEEVIDLIESLPDTDEVKKADKEQILAARNAYEALSKYEKTLVDRDLKVGLNNVIKAYNKLVTSSADKSDTEESSKTSSSKTNSTKTSSTKKNRTTSSGRISPVTGDENNLLLWSGLMVLAIIAVVGSVIIKRKNRIKN